MTHQRSRLSQRLGGGAIALGLAVAALAATWNQPARFGCWDFYQFWMTGRAVAVDDVEDVYAGPERERLARAGVEQAVDESARRPVSGRRLIAAKARPALENYSTPLLYTMFGLTSVGDYDRDLDRFRGFSTFLFVFGIIALGRSLGYGWPRLMAFVAVLIFWFLPAYSDALQGNVNRPQLGMLALALAMGRPGVGGWSISMGGALLGFLIAFKPNTLLVALLLLAIPALARDYRRAMLRVAGIGAGGIAGFALSVAFFGSYRPWIVWIGRLRDLHLEEFPTKDGNTALSQVLLELTGLHLSLPLSIVFFGLVICWLLLAKRVLVVRAADRHRADASRRSFSMEIAAAGLGAALPLFTSHLAWAHYHTFSALMALYLLRPRVAGDLEPDRFARTTSLIVALFGFGLMCIPLGTTVIGGTLVLFGLVVTEPMWGATRIGAAPSCADLSSAPARGRRIAQPDG